MKPEQWIIEDMRRMRSIKERSNIEEQYLELLVWYVKVLNSKGE